MLLAAFKNQIYGSHRFQARSSSAAGYPEENLDPLLTFPYVYAPGEHYKLLGRLTISSLVAVPQKIHAEEEEKLVRY